MQEHHLFEYAVIRVVPRVEREEFLNIGIILFCASRKFLELKYALDTERFRVFTGDMDAAVLEENLLAFCRICQGGQLAGPIGLYLPGSAFAGSPPAAAVFCKLQKRIPDFVKILRSL